MDGVQVTGLVQPQPCLQSAMKNCHSTRELRGGNITSYPRDDVIFINIYVIKSDISNSYVAKNYFLMLYCAINLQAKLEISRQTSFLEYISSIHYI